MAACNGDVTRSALHVVVIDEIDAVFRRRTSGEDSGEQTRVSFTSNTISRCFKVFCILAAVSYSFLEHI